MAEGNARACYTGAKVLDLLDIDIEDGGFDEYCFDEFEDIIDEIYDHDKVNR